VWSGVKVHSELDHIGPLHVVVGIHGHWLIHGALARPQSGQTQPYCLDGFIVYVYDAVPVDVPVPVDVVVLSINFLPGAITFS
jgi:hypothetical protein